MADNDQDHSKTEQATPFKLREAKRRGQVWKSLELNSFVLLTAVLGILYWSGQDMLIQQLNLSQVIFSNSAEYAVSPSQVFELFGATTTAMFGIFFPMIAVVVVVGILSNVFQTGPVFSFFPLKPDAKRLSPVAGFKRIFSARMLFEAVKTMIKLGLMGAVLFFALVTAVGQSLGMMDSDPDSYPIYILNEIYMISFKLLLVLLLIALVDLMFTRWDFSKKMRMSHRDIKDEVKRREGDPLIRAKLRELQREAAMRAKSIGRVPDADVLITNPTHISIALKYDRLTMDSPQVVAKGGGELATKLRQVARENNVPIVENKKVARLLFKHVDIDRPVPEECFAQVAKILVWVYSMEQGRTAAATGV